MRRIAELESENKKAMETIGRLACRLIQQSEPVRQEQDDENNDEDVPELLTFDQLGERIIDGREPIHQFLDRVKGQDTAKIRELDEKRSRPLRPLPKPLFERQASDVCDIHYLDRHPETPLELAEVLRREKRMTIDELSTDDIAKAVELFEEPIILTQRDALLEGLGRYLEQLQRERSGSEGDTDLLAKKRIPR
jgi:hypothetical protein